MARLRARDTGAAVEIRIAERPDAGVDVIVRCGDDERCHERRRTASAVEAVGATVAARIADGTSS